MDRQCSSCGGFCKKSGCERENVKPEQEPQIKQRTGDCLLTGVCAAEGHRIQKPQRQQRTYTLRKWQGLTDEECLQNPYCAGENDIEVIQLARAIETKLKEKNSG